MRWLNKICDSGYRGQYRVWMSAGELDIEERILMTRTEYFF